MKTEVEVVKKLVQGNDHTWITSPFEHIAREMGIAYNPFDSCPLGPLARLLGQPILLLELQFAVVDGQRRGYEDVAEINEREDAGSCEMHAETYAEIQVEAGESLLAISKAKPAGEVEWGLIDDAIMVEVYNNFVLTSDDDVGHALATRAMELHKENAGLEEWAILDKESFDLARSIGQDTSPAVQTVCIDVRVHCSTRSDCMHTFDHFFLGVDSSPEARVWTHNKLVEIVIIQLRAA